MSEIPITVREDGITFPDERTVIHLVESYSTMSDRELMEHIARSQDQMLGFVAGIASQVEPMIESLQTHPLLKSFFGGKS